MPALRLTLSLKLSLLMPRMIDWCRIRSSIAAVSTLSPAEALIPTAEGKIRSEDHRTAFIALRHDRKNRLACSRLIGR